MLAGPPGATLRQFAQQQDMDLVVVGRRGRGLNETNAASPRRAANKATTAGAGDPR